MTLLDSNMEDFCVEHGIASVDEEVTVYLSEKREDKETGIWNNKGDRDSQNKRIFNDEEASLVGTLKDLQIDVGDSEVSPTPDGEQVDETSETHVLGDVVCVDGPDDDTFAAQFAPLLIDVSQTAAEDWFLHFAQSLTSAK